MIRIINLRSYSLQKDEILIKIDRSSVLGNPFFMNNETERNTVCDKYEIYARKQIQDNIKFKEEIKRIKTIKENVALGCWCFPKRCHGLTILKLIETI